MLYAILRDHTNCHVHAMMIDAILNTVLDAILSAMLDDVPCLMHLNMVHCISPQVAPVGREAENYSSVP